jgi:hypothetical protein
MNIAISPILVDLWTVVTDHDLDRSPLIACELVAKRIVPESVGFSGERSKAVHANGRRRWLADW